MQPFETDGRKSGGWEADDTKMIVCSRLQDQILVCTVRDATVEPKRTPHEPAEKTPLVRCGVKLGRYFADGRWFFTTLRGTTMGKGLVRTVASSTVDNMLCAGAACGVMGSDVSPGVRLLCRARDESSANPGNHSARHRPWSILTWPYQQYPHFYDPPREKCLA